MTGSDKTGSDKAGSDKAGSGASGPECVILDLTIRSDPKELASVRERTRSVASAIGFAPKATDGIVLAVDEALANVIRHSYKEDPNNPIEIRMSPCEPDERRGIEITIRDYGQQVDVDSICGRCLDEPRPGGLGVHIIMSVMEKAEYSHAEGGGMRLRMLKFLPTEG